MYKTLQLVKQGSIKVVFLHNYAIVGIRRKEETKKDRRTRRRRRTRVRTRVRRNFYIYKLPIDRSAAVTGNNPFVQL